MIGRRVPWSVEGLSRALLVALVVSLPFELKTALFVVGPFSVTNVELLLYGTLAAWLAGHARAGRCPTVPLSWPHAALMGAMLLSAAVAPIERVLALKFAARASLGCLLSVAVIDLVRSPRQVQLLIRALAAGAVVSAATGAAEVEFTQMQSWLAPFKTQPTFASGFLRASGTFQYANTAAMYWEASLPLLVGIAAARGKAPRWRDCHVWLAFVGVVIVCAGLVTSASRAGLMAAAISLGALAWPGHLKVPEIRRLAFLGLAVLLAAFVAYGWHTGLLALRLRASDAGEWHRAAWLQTPARIEIPSGTTTRVRVRLRNTGVLVWTAGGEQPVFVSYHWMRGEAVAWFEGARTRLPRDVPPGEEVAVDALVFGNRPTGDQQLQWDLVREGVTWFSAEGGPVAYTDVRIRAPRDAQREPTDVGPTVVRPDVRPSRQLLWRAAWDIWRQYPATGIGPDNFRHAYGRFAGLQTFDDRITANSVFFEIVSTLGVVGLGAWGWLLLSLARRGRAWWKAPSGGDVAGLTLMAALLSFGLHGVVDYFLPYTPTYGLFWVLVGLAGRSWTGFADPVPPAVDGRTA